MLTIEKFYTRLTSDIKAEVELAKENFILGADITELVNYFCFQKMLAPIEVDNTREITSEIVTHTDTRLPSTYEKLQALLERKGDFGIETLVIEIPIKVNLSNAKVCELCAYNHEDQWMQLKEDIISIKVVIKEHSSIKSTEKINEETINRKNEAFNWLRTIQQNIARLNQHLLADIKHSIESRRSQLTATKKRHEEIIRTINIPLKRKEDNDSKRIQLDRSPLVKRIMPTIAAKEEYKLQREKVLDIIHVLDNQGRQFEKTPYSYRSLGEEDLRNILLVNLNAIFEGRAIGEAFSYMGKTDIMLNIDKGNILVMECKIWKGQKNHMEAVTQLLSYLTWRHNYGIVINFCRVKDMSKAIKEVFAEIKNQKGYLRPGKTSKETHFSTVHQSPLDSGKEIEVHHIFYNLYLVNENSNS